MRVDASDDSFLANLVARYEESLTGIGSFADLDFSRLESNPSLAKRWQSAKTSLDKMHRAMQSLDQINFSDHSEVNRPIPLFLFQSNLPRTLGPFEIERLLGAGGIGLVYLARDIRLERRVALKVPRIETLANEELRSRFLREGEAAARLSHPHVVSVLETGRDDQLCYIASEYCEGPTLAEWIHERKGKVSVTLAATLVRKLSDAVQHAHSRGVLHRDIKPSNVMLARDPNRIDSSSDQEQLTPKLTDFGMAKLQETHYDETKTGSTIGTPAYMAPEQAAGKVREIDSRTDVYALGVTLYELLTGEQPFRGDAPMETLRRVLDEDPVPIRRIRPDVPIDLEAICLKCLAKAPLERYQIAQQLTDDLDRFLAGEPIMARPAGSLEKFWKLIRRRPLQVGGITAIVSSLLALFIVITVYNSRLRTEIVRADKEAENSRRLLYAANVRLAHQALSSNNVPQTLKLLDDCRPMPGQEDLREFTWHYLRAACEQQGLTLQGHEGDVFSVVYSPDGKVLASVGKDGTVRLWDSSTGKALNILRGHTTETTCVVFSPDGKWLATGSEDHTVRIWDWRKGISARLIDASNDHILCVAFSSDGKLLATGGREHVVRIWNVIDGERIAELSTNEGVPRALRFLPNGESLLASDEEGRLHSWRIVDWSERKMIARSDEVYFSLAVSADSSLIAAAGRQEDIEIYSQKTGDLELMTTIPAAHSGWIQSLAFHPLDKVLASSGYDGTIKLWSPNTWRLTRTVIGHSGRVWSVAWSPDGKYLASAGADGQIRVWGGGDGQQRQSPAEQHTIRDVAALDTAGDMILTSLVYGDRHYWDTSVYPYRAIKKQPLTLAKGIDVVQFHLSPDRNRVAIITGELTGTSISSLDTTVEIHTLEPLRKLWSRPRNRTWSIRLLAWSKRGNLLASNIEKKTEMTILDAETGQTVRRLDVGARIAGGAFLSDDSLVISSAADVRVWDHVNSRIRWSLPGSYQSLVISPDNRRIAVGEREGIIILDAITGQVLSRIPVQGGEYGMAISPDSRTLAACTQNPNKIELWDMQTGSLLISIPTFNQLPSRVIFTADGKRLFARVSMQENEIVTGQIMEWSVGASE